MSDYETILTERVAGVLKITLNRPERLNAASIPLAMERMLETGEAPHGGTALLIGFGAGLVYAAQVVTLP